MKRQTILGYALSCALFLLLPSQVGFAAISIFGALETASTNLDAFKYWNAVLQRIEEQKAEIKQRPCNQSNQLTCNYDQFLAFVAGLKGKDKLTQLQEINQIVNRAKYLTDQDNWSQKDYWNTPLEFMARFGDCEDHAITKFLALELLNFPKDQYRIVAVQDLNLKVGHAILVVEVDGKSYLLDNQINQVVDVASVRHYQPVFSINRTTWWRHSKSP